MHYFVPLVFGAFLQKRMRVTERVTPRRYKRHITTAHNGAHVRRAPSDRVFGNRYARERPAASSNSPSVAFL